MVEGRDSHHHYHHQQSSSSTPQHLFAYPVALTVFITNYYLIVVLLPLLLLIPNAVPKHGTRHLHTISAGWMSRRRVLGVSNYIILEQG